MPRDEIFARYKLAGEDDGGTVKYYGYLSISGAWYILESDTTAKTYKYAKGTSDFSTNWTNRAGLTYQFYNEAFIG